ncbi:MAG: hypothetical protein KIT22_05065 [Verrucomicrobiae bacterium]|nr:hypothetical protein [Verrucomicrobiae bacterium]
MDSLVEEKTRIARIFTDVIKCQAIYPILVMEFDIVNDNKISGLSKDLALCVGRPASLSFWPAGRA